MSDKVDHLSFEATGNGAVESIMSILDGFVDDGGFDRVYVEVGYPSKGNKTKERQTSLPAAVTESENSKGPKSIQRGTSHHKLLSALKQLEDETPIPTKGTLDLVDIPEGTAYAAMSALYERGLVNRTNEKNEDNSYEYEINSAGESELERLGVIN